MTQVSNDPSWWPFINWTRFFSYWIVAASAAVIYDWALTLEQEVELVWKQRWSLMTVLFLAIRYIGITYSIIGMLFSLPSVLTTNVGCKNMAYTISWTNVVVATMLGVIVIARLHAMYQGSIKMLIFVIVIFLAFKIACGVINAIGSKYIVGEEMKLSGTYVCGYDFEGNARLLIIMVWTLNTAWEVIALCLAVYIAVKHFCDLRQFGPSTGPTIGSYFTVLVKSHALYFASFAIVSGLSFIELSSNILDSTPIGIVISSGALEIFSVMKMFVLGPRLILSIREYHTKLVADSDAGASMPSIAFEERVHVSTSISV